MNQNVAEEAFFFGGSEEVEESEDSELVEYSGLSDFSDDSVFERVSEDDEGSLGDVFFGDDGTTEEETDEEKEKETSSVPFWYANEDAEHVEVVMEKYCEELIEEDEFQRSVQPFIGSIARSQAGFSSLFQTFDTIEICNNQRMPPHSTIPIIRTVYLLTSWDADGVPISFFKIPPERVSSWISKTDNQTCSYFYCFPDWFQQTPGSDGSKFIFSVSHEYKAVTYANLPWDNTPFHQCVNLATFSSNQNAPFRLSSNRFSP